MTVVLHEGDCLTVTPQLAADGLMVDAVVTDPPYHLTATVKRFQTAAIGGSTDVERRAKSRTDGLGRLAGGFMGLQWDGGDIAFRPETWATVATILRPGGFLLAFGGTRTFHRVWCAIEDAGFVIQDTIMWMYGSGFPKRRDMLKPAWEPICVAYKPGGKRTLQVDECRIPTDGKSPSVERRSAAERSGNYGRIGDRHNGDAGKFRANGNRAEGLANYLADKDGEAFGRWPANVCHDGSAEVMEVHSGEGWTQLDGGSASRFFYCAKADGEDRWGSRHPTVKPIELLKWLVSLVTPKGGTFLDPFAGSGTAAVAALATGRNAILIEREAGYCADIRERIAHYEGEGRHSLASKGRAQSVAPLGGLFA